jgi:hypothetical protein
VHAIYVLEVILCQIKIGFFSFVWPSLKIWTFYRQKWRYCSGAMQRPESIHKVEAPELNSVAIGRVVAVRVIIIIIIILPPRPMWSIVLETP